MLNPDRRMLLVEFLNQGQRILCGRARISNQAALLFGSFDELRLSFSGRQFHDSRKRRLATLRLCYNGQAS
jgi:hypothetical protein